MAERLDVTGTSRTAAPIPRAVTRNFAPTPYPGMEEVTFTIAAVMAAIPAYERFGACHTPPTRSARATLCVVNVLDVAFWSTPYDSEAWGPELAYMASMVDAMRSGVEFPPLVVFNRGGEPFVDDGFHRISAALAAGVDTMLAFVFPA